MDANVSQYYNADGTCPRCLGPEETPSERCSLCAATCDRATGNRAATFTWLRNYLDFSDASAVLQSADNTNQPFYWYAADAPNCPGTIIMSNNGDGTYTATLRKELP